MENIKLFIPTIAVQIYTVVDKTMLGLFTEDAVENGYYEQAEKVAKIALSVVTSLPVVIAPRIGKLISENRKNDILDYMYRSYSVVWAM